MAAMRELPPLRPRWKEMNSKNPPDINDIPVPPRRLYDDRRLLNFSDTPEWQGRRANKMRERFPVDDHQTARGASLVAPVQPSIPAYTPAGRML